MRVYKIRIENTPPWLCLPTLEAVMEEIRHGNNGDRWEVEIDDDLTQEQLDELPEFDGW